MKQKSKPGGEEIWSLCNGMKGEKFRQLVNKLPHRVSPDRTAEIYYDLPVGSTFSWTQTIFAFAHKNYTCDSTEV